ncbi:DUF5681 domain-containing protein [Allosphingosinicella deserti]|uniref:DUF5681 domain-containing protein n=1 Tax=Allosphingosinicella deserti TaxID=2116704 RepID=A0A2P7QEY5_9SPHN|nr:DUF5681 domain-containing protein [Sphingomonas deserti]PSJ36485.1 hypothetical protein C7I55_25775 [Sphingomonas deserti]
MHDPDTPIRSEAGQFLPGYSGNMAGRPRGSRNRASVLRDLVDAGEAASIARMVVSRAIDGDWAAMRICFTRLFPPAREGTMNFELPEITTIADAVAAGAALVSGAGGGDIPPGEARKLMALLATQTKLIQAEARAEALRTDAEARRAKAEAAIPEATVGAGTPPTQAEDAPAAPIPHPSLDAHAAAPRPACISPVLLTEAEQPALDESTAGRPPAPAGAEPASPPLTAPGSPPSTESAAPATGCRANPLAAAHLRQPGVGTESLYREMCEGLRQSLAFAQSAEAPEPGGGTAETPMETLPTATPARDLTAQDVRSLFLLPPRTCASARPLRRAALRPPAPAGAGATTFAADSGTSGPKSLADRARLATLHRPPAPQGAA